MLKTVSSITNALGALNFKGTWDANANSPALSSSVGTKGDYYVVGTAGSTNLNGISNWGIGDWATFNGSVWQRVEGGADLNGVNLSVSGTSTLSALTASTALALNASKEIVSVTNTGTGNNVLATTPTLVGDVTLSTGNLVVSNGKGIDFSLTPGTGTSELLADYEEGTWTPTLVTTGAGFTSITYSGFTGGRYIKVGSVVHIQCILATDALTVGAASGNVQIGGLPFASAAASLGLNGRSAFSVGQASNFAINHPSGAFINNSSSVIFLMYRLTASGGLLELAPSDLGTGGTNNFILLSGTYVSA